MDNIHSLLPCSWCPTRMAQPGKPVCTTCEAEALNEIEAL